MKLFLVVYNAVGLISGVSGPIIVPEHCTNYAQQATDRVLAHPEQEQLTFRCEWHDERPKIDPRTE